MLGVTTNRLINAGRSLMTASRHTCRGIFRILRVAQNRWATRGNRPRTCHDSSRERWRPTFVAVPGCLREVRHRQRREEPEHVCGRPGAAAASRLPGAAFLSAAAASKREYRLPISSSLPPQPPLSHSFCCKVSIYWYPTGYMYVAPRLLDAFKYKLYDCLLNGKLLDLVKCFEPYDIIN